MRTGVKGMLAAALLVPATPNPAQAQAEARLITITPTAAWGHAETGMILPPRVAGLGRGEIRDAGGNEQDISVAYAGDGATVTIALYRTMVPDPAIWFDRAALLAAPPAPGTEFAPPAATAFARPGSAIASGLRGSIATGSGGIAIAAIRLGDWLLIVRMQAAQLDPAALDARLTAFLAGLRWPTATADATAAAVAPIQPCREPLRLRQARLVRTEGANVLMDLIGAAVAHNQTEERRTPPPVYCREAGANVGRGVYRANGSEHAYLIALGAGGIGLQLGNALDISELGGGQRRVSMMLLGRDSTSAFPSFNRLPPPDQAIAVARGGGATMSTTISDPAPR